MAANDSQRQCRIWNDKCRPGPGDRQQASPAMLAHKWENAFTLDADSHNAWGYVHPDVKVVTILTPPCIFR